MLLVHHLPGEWMLLQNQLQGHHSIMIPDMSMTSGKGVQGTGPLMVEGGRSRGGRSLMIAGLGAAAATASAGAAAPLTGGGGAAGAEAEAGGDYLVFMMGVATNCSFM